MMKYILKYSLGCIALAALASGIVSCNDEESSEVVPAIYPSSIELEVPAELETYIYYDPELGIHVLPLLKGERVTLGYSIYPENITYDDVIWFSSEESVATVDATGTVSAISGDRLGYSIIQVSPDPYYAGSNIFSTLKVEVSNTLVPASAITLFSEEDEVFAGETLQLSVSVLPENATYKTVAWSSSDPTVATVDHRGLLTAHTSIITATPVTITATSLDGAGVVASKEILVNVVIQPEDITIDQTYSADNYPWAINQKYVELDYTVEPAYCTLSLIEWESSNENIATVENGVVTFNQSGVFGDVTITATCPETGNSSSIRLHLAEGLLRELFQDENNYTWADAGQSGNGTSTSTAWEYGKVAVTTYKVNDNRQRADFKCKEAASYLHIGNYPIFAIRMEDVIDRDDVTIRNINLDVSGSAGGTTYSGNVGGNNNKWAYDYKCSDGSHVFVYDFSTQECANGGLLPNSLVTFNTLQMKYADIGEIGHQLTYNVYWVQTFKSVAEVEAYITSEGLTFE